MKISGAPPVAVQLTLWASVVLLVGCDANFGGQAARMTAWPTLAPLGSIDGGQVQASSGPQLADIFRADVRPDAQSVFPLSGNTSQAVRIEAIALSGKVDPFIVISNQYGHALAEVNLRGPGEPEVIGTFSFPTNSYYQLSVGSSSGEGEIGVSVYQLPNRETDTTIELVANSEVVSGELESPASFKTYVADLERGQRIDFTATAQTESLDIKLSVYTPDGHLAVESDDVVNKNPAIYNYLVDMTGAHTIVLSNVDERTGAYTLRVERSVPAVDAQINRLAVVQPQVKPFRSEIIALSGKMLDGIYIEARGTDSGVDPAFSIVDPYGNRLLTEDEFGPEHRESAALVQFPFDGEYQIEFWNMGTEGQIQYYIRPVRAPDAGIGGRIYPGGRSEKGEIFSAGTYAAYYFDAESGSLIGIEALQTSQTGLDLGFDLFAPDGARMVTRDDTIGKDPVLDRIELPLSGRYVLYVWNFGQSYGTYIVSVTLPEAPSTQPN